ncbi:hypothetical protein C8Q74DRAFT_1290683 [Fomes fomentarius]|nr:hypothetical protein C8Q74DRAFT_1290683 [Fomes fomentarius]
MGRDKGGDSIIAGDLPSATASGLAGTGECGGGKFRRDSGAVQASLACSKKSRWNRTRETQRPSTSLAPALALSHPGPQPHPPAHPIRLTEMVTRRGARSCDSIP